jgi:hypothetical protein
MRTDARKATTISSDVGGESEAREKAAMRLRKASQYNIFAVTTGQISQPRLRGSIDDRDGPRKANQRFCAGFRALAGPFEAPLGAGPETAVRTRLSRR